MAVFGPQLIFTVIMFVLLTKLGKYYSFGRFLLCYKLFRYLSPGNEELKKSVRTFYKTNATNSKNKKLSKMFEIDDDKEDFNIPEGCTVELSMSPVVPYDLNFIKYTDDFQTFVDLAVAAIGIYASTELYLSVTGRASDEINLSLVWCLMALAYGLATLSSITVNYLRSASEASLLYVFAALSFIVSLLIQMADTRLFDFNLLDAFRNVSRTTFELISNHSSSTAGKTTNENKPPTNLKNYPTDELLFTVLIATLSGLIGALLFFPAFRLARLHFLCLKYSLGSKVKRFFYYLNFFLPLAVSVCWLKSDGFRRATPIKAASDTATDNTAGESIVSEFLSMVTPPHSDAPLTYSKQLQANITSIIFSPNFKIYVALALFLLRLVLYRFYAQSYLNLAFEMASYLKKNTQRMTSSVYIKTISSVYQYYGVVASQYIIPLFVLLFMVFLLKTLGDLSWCGDCQACNDLVVTLGDLSTWLKPVNATSSPTLSGILHRFESENFNVTMTHSALNKIFTPFVFRSLIGYFTFWTCTVWFLISCFGLLYYHYIDRQYIFND